MRVALALLLCSSVARADDLCAPDARHHGKAIDLDLQQADVRDVMRLLADTANVNLVVADDVTGKVTLRVKRVAWDAAACTIAAVQHLRIARQDNILIVTRAK